MRCCNLFCGLPGSLLLIGAGLGASPSEAGLWFLVLSRPPASDCCTAGPGQGLFQELTSFWLLCSHWLSIFLLSLSCPHLSHVCASQKSPGHWRGPMCAYLSFELHQNGKSSGRTTEELKPEEGPWV